MFGAFSFISTFFKKNCTCCSHFAAHPLPKCFVITIQIRISKIIVTGGASIWCIFIGFFLWLVLILKKSFLTFIFFACLHEKKKCMGYFLSELDEKVPILKDSGKTLLKREQGMLISLLGFPWNNSIIPIMRVCMYERGRIKVFWWQLPAVCVPRRPTTLPFLV